MAKDLIPAQQITNLVNKIQEEIFRGKERLRVNLENEKTVTYCKIGKHIHEHLLNYGERADYGDYLFKKLSEQLNMGIRTLYRSVQFYETYPEIVSALTQLTWGHFIVSQLKDCEYVVIKTGAILKTGFFQFSLTFIKVYPLIK